jgi:uncharacterized membrane protein YvbJ
MVYCSKCGTLNADDANVCVKCGAPLQSADTGPYWRHRHYRDEYYRDHARRGGGMGALFVGIIIVIVGLSLLLSQMYGIQLSWAYFWAFIIIFIGIWLLVRALVWHRRR